MKNTPGSSIPILRLTAICTGLLGVLILIFTTTFTVRAWTPKQVTSDPLVRMPGTQPGQTTIEGPGRCLNCHANYNPSVEPGFNWQGSMMAQASRDFLFWACMTVAAQDSIWAVGTPNATDICLRCHFPKGWLEGRSDPTNASLMTGADYDGVQCDFCHTQYDPFFQTTYDGTREGSDWLTYWDETNLSATKSSGAALVTVTEDRTQSVAITLFNGAKFYASYLTPASYMENAAGQYFTSSGTEKRASFADATARHTFLYSRYHKSKYFCATCHDVSNPVLANLGDDPSQPLTTETQSAYSYYHVERTFSEFMLSAYGQSGGAAGIGPFAPDVFETSDPANKIARCQDCHMRDVSGMAANKNDAVNRPSGSIEHPQSGQPLHDLTGGNVWVSRVLASTVTGSPNYNAVNSQLLSQGPAVLTLDLTQGVPMNAAALLAGAERAMQQLTLAAAIRDAAYDNLTGQLTFKVQNQTGHKLISGFPEGRRMFLNIRAYDSGGQLLYEINPYDQNASTLKGLTYPYSSALTLPQSLSINETNLDTLIYETLPSSELTGEEHTFHFALATNRYKDNRIPPVGFRIDQAATRLAHPRYDGEDAYDYFTAAEYAGGYDEVAVSLPDTTNAIEINLYYQTTSREYIEFLRDEINGTGNLTLTGTGAGGDPAYLISTDPFFAKMKAWGNTIWQLWLNNRQIPGAQPILMTQQVINGVGGCTVSVPDLVSVIPASNKATLNWSDEHSQDPAVKGYRIYYDLSGKAQLRAEVGLQTTYIDLGLNNGQQYCYRVTAFTDQCESRFSNMICVIPQDTVLPTRTNTPTRTVTATPTTTQTPTNTVTTTPTSTNTPTITVTTTPTNTVTQTPTTTSTLTQTPTTTQDPGLGHKVYLPMILRGDSSLNSTRGSSTGGGLLPAWLRTLQEWLTGLLVE